MNHDDDINGLFVRLRVKHVDGFLSHEEYVHSLEVVSRKAELALRVVPTPQAYAEDMARRRGLA